ncbi:MAG: hypothetical protein ABSG59_19685 [Verrucomicrobiota bacterium]|jgi:hypothetical protein
MERVLHILTRPQDDLARSLIACQQSAGKKTEVVDLTAPRPDYGQLLEKIFAADSVECW